MQGQDNRTPQEALRQARADLLKLLAEALRVVDHPDANPATIGGAMNALAAAQQNYNNAVIRIPLALMTDGVLFNDLGAAPPPPESLTLTPERAVEIIGSESPLQTTNARKWADTFLAVNKNNAIDRESLVGWFANAIETGREHEALRHGTGGTKPPTE